VWFSTPREKRIGDTRLRFDPTNPWWTRVKEVTEAFARRFAGRMVFGHTDLGGNLDVLASIRGTERLLLEMVDSPAEVDRLAREITGLWLRIYDELAAILRGRCRAFSSWAPL
jgi:hypothetical protein